MISEKRFTQRFDVVMTSFLSGKIKKNSLNMQGGKKK